MGPYYVEVWRTKSLSAEDCAAFHSFERALRWIKSWQQADTETVARMATREPLSSEQQELLVQRDIYLEAI